MGVFKNGVTPSPVRITHGRSSKVELRLPRSVLEMDVTPRWSYALLNLVVEMGVTPLWSYAFSHCILKIGVTPLWSYAHWLVFFLEIRLLLARFTIFPTFIAPKWSGKKWNTWFIFSTKIEHYSKNQNTQKSHFHQKWSYALCYLTRRNYLCQSLKINQCVRDWQSKNTLKHVQQ